MARRKERKARKSPQRTLCMVPPAQVQLLYLSDARSLRRQYMCICSLCLQDANAPNTKDVRIPFAITWALSAQSGAGDAAALKQLLEDGADKDEQDEEGRTALHFACGYGEMACVDALLQAKANLDAIDHNKNTALHYAAGYGQPEVVELLLKQYASHHDVLCHQYLLRFDQSRP